MNTSQFPVPCTTPWVSAESAALQSTQIFHQKALYSIEQSESYIAYMTLLHLQRASPNNVSLTQEVNQLYDKVFYLASRILRWDDGTMAVTVPLGSMVRLNDKVPVDGLSTVNELRQSNKPGILFSGVGAISIQTAEWLRIPLLKRDSWAPSDAGKYTLPAGRADKSPGLTAYEEILEEIVIFGKKDGKMHLIVPYMADGGISEEKAKTLVNIARAKYLSKLVEKWGSQDNIIQEMLSAEAMIVPMNLWKWWESIKTIFEWTSWQKPHEVIETGIFPIHDVPNNTYEMVRSLSLNLSGFRDLHLWDGDGFGRDTAFFTLDQIQNMDLDMDVVAALKWAIEKGIFDQK